MNIINEMRVDFLAVPENEAFARMVVSAFILPFNPTLEQLGDVKTSISEAVTNAIVHGYRSKKGTVRMKGVLTDTGLLQVEVIDNGVGIEDVNKARQPFYTSLNDSERSGMGFTVMESFMDSIEVYSALGQGTTVHMSKQIADAPLAAAKRA